MNILMISIFKESKYGAGAAVASIRLKNMLEKKGNKVHFHTAEDLEKFQVDKSLFMLEKNNSAFWPINSNSCNTQYIKKINEEFDPDIIILGAVDRGIIDLFSICEINKPILWICRDNLVHTGGCLFLNDQRETMYNFNEKSNLSLYDCEKYNNHCGSCPVINSDDEFDITRLTYLQKQYLYNFRSDITFVAISNWMKEMLSEASLTKNHKIEVINNPIDISKYRMFDHERILKIRKKLKLPVNKKLLLFNAQSIANPRKGYGLIEEVLIDSTFASNDVELVVMGKSDNISSKLLKKYTIHNMGYISNEDKKIELLNSVDITLIGAIQETLSVVAAESLACGTPVISFRNGGLVDLVKHKNNGYLVDPFDKNEYIKGLQWLIDKNCNNEISNNATRFIHDNFNEEIISNKYLNVINNTITEFKGISMSNEFKFIKNSYYSFFNNQYKYSKKINELVILNRRKRELLERYNKNDYNNKSIILSKILNKMRGK